MKLSLQAARGTFLIILVGMLSACAVPSGPRYSGEVMDPYEKQNRGVHKFNLAVDRSLFRPASKGYVTIVPDFMVTSFSSFAANFQEPGNAVNAVLQGNPKRAGTAVGRFLVNTIVGFGGLGDPASELGLMPDPTDFGETMHVWGVPEGAYVELPFFGPSTQRDSVGLLVDFFTNPLGPAGGTRAQNTGRVSYVVDKMGSRGRYSDTVDDILYNSADSYAQARIIYLQNRRFELAGENGQTYSDPYADLYGDTSADPYADSSTDPYAATSTDPYEDPYAE